MIKLSNFKYDNIFVKIESSSWKKRLRGKISEIEQNDVKNDFIDQKREMVSKRHITKMFL